MNDDDFVHLHTHTHASAFDGLGRPDEFVEKVARLGQPAVAFSEHGTLRGLYESAEACRSSGVKLIPAAELYLADNASRQGLSDEEKAEVRARATSAGTDEKEALKAAERARRERDHITVWAVNDVGLRNLYRLTAWSWGPGFYYKPRIDLDVLTAHSEGLAVSSGCPGGVICSPLRTGDVRVALDRAERLAQVFGDRFLVELMPHVPEENCIGLASKLVKLADRFGATLIATQDAHYPHEEDSVAQETLLCIHTRSKMDDPDRFVFDERDYWLKTRPELERAFATHLPGLPPAVWKRAMDNTVAFAERCTAEVKVEKVGRYLVAPQLPQGVRDYNDWLTQLCRAGIDERFPEGWGEEYTARLMHELRTIKGLGFAAYFTATWDVRRWARSVGIFAGPGRGSAAGCLVSYLLRITDLDPVEHGLSFERFLAPGRKDLPDIDLDFESARRGEVIDYLRATYGDDRVAHISTHNTLGGKAALRDLARIYGIPERDVAPVSALIIPPTDEGSRTDDTLVRVLEDTDAGRAFSERYPDVVAVAARLEGQIRDIGLHASGIVLSSVPLADVTPMETRSPKGGPRVPATGLDMHGVEAAGLVKLDVLGVRTLSALRRAFETSGRSPAEIDFRDEATLQGFTDGKFGGVFQYDTPSARRLCRGYHFKRFADVAVMTALNRPGPAKSGLAKEYVDRAADPSKVESVHPIYDRVMAETYGVPVYQEQVIALVVQLCGYTPQEADAFRKKVAKKLGLDDEEPKFIEGAMASGMERPQAEHLFKSLVGFARYAFNKAHSVSYGAVAFWGMWLKVHHPPAFYAATLAEEGDAQVQIRLAGEARRSGIPVLPPDVNNPGDGFNVLETADGAQIVGSVGDLKGIGPSTAKVIAAGVPYADLADFYARTAGGGARVTAKTFEILSSAGAFRSLFPHAKILAVNAKEVWSGLKAGWAPEPPPELPDYTDEEMVAKVAEVWPLFTAIAGRGKFERLEELLRSQATAPIYEPGDEDLHEPGLRLVLARIAGHKVFTGDTGKSVRVALASADGDEMPCRADEDVFEAAGPLLTSVGSLALALVHSRGMGSVPSLECVWTAERLPPDPVLAWAMAPGKTKPRDPSKALLNADDDQVFSVQGVVTRVQKKRSQKSGAKMLLVGLLGTKGYLRFYVFSSRLADVDVRQLQPGEFVQVRLRKLSGGDAACLSDHSVSKPDGAEG